MRPGSRVPGNKDAAVKHTNSVVPWAQIKTWLDLLVTEGSWAGSMFF